jgi:16S rRNA (guanine(966)-N(2))-methyltransferase RsmD
MPDRVKAAVFSMLGSRYGLPGMLPPLRVTDAFAGSGALGLEALSRGAAFCWFIERDRDALAVLRRNLDALGAADRATIVAGDAWSAAVRAPDGQPFELILLDPPYRDSLDPSPDGPVQKFLARLAESPDNRPLVLLHHPAEVRYVLSNEQRWRAVDVRTFGTHAVTLFAR